ncbi:unnamed protein product, partial [Adineta steineri]
MFHMKYIFYLIFVHWIVAIPQINLYFTNQVSESENYDEIGIRYNCIRLASNLDQDDLTRQISSYCMSESSLKFHIENDNSFQTFSFADLAKMNITSEDLYFWSTPIDITEEYQFYLQSNDSSLAKKIFYNCTLPRFGSMCQYEFCYYHENYSSLYEMIFSYYVDYLYDPTNLTCYTHLKCNRGYSPACLDWTEICDGKVDCLDGEYDEEHCWELEFNECKPNEYQCDNGLCVPNEFVEDDPMNFDCIDGSDEQLQTDYVSSEVYTIEPTFGYEDLMCKQISLTSSCLISRRLILMYSLFSIKDNNVSNECWSAYKCYFAIRTAEHPYITFNVINQECIPIIKDECPDMLYVPNIPVFFGHIYTAYKKNELSHPLRIEPPYLCSNKSFYDDSLSLVLETVLNNTMCFKVSRFTSWQTAGTPDFVQRFERSMNDIFRQIRQIHSITNFPLHRCNQSHLYQCRNSSKCILFRRLINGVTDCPYNDDENISEDTNPQLFAQVKHKYYKCHVTNKSIPQMALFNNDCDCESDEYDFCEDLDDYGNFTRRTISFQTICDGFQELYPIMIDGKNQTDETECEQWECDNMYTQCDKIWNCLDGKDEMNCDYSLPPLINCSSDYRMCVTLDTYKLTCLPINKTNDGIPDCLGRTDERASCRTPYGNSDAVFYCQGEDNPVCLYSKDLCDGYVDCLDDDDEQFCQKNRSFEMDSSICEDEYISFGSDAEKFLCDITKEYKKEEIKYFTIDGFNQSSENEVNENQQIDVIHTDLLDDPRCHRGLDLRVWLNKSSNPNFTSTCLCPPTYYGNQCQYQNQRLSLSVRFYDSVQSIQTLFAILIMLIDNTNQRMIHSYEQFTYLPKRDCKVKFNIYLVYSTRPKDMNKNYSVHIDIYEKISLKYRASYSYPVEFLFLPVHRLAFIINIPSEDDYSCSNKKCLHGKCLNYFNTKETLCQCEQGWSGQYCDIPHNNCNCSSNSICIGRASDNQSICICREYYFGSKCYLRNRICDNSPCRNNGLCIPHDDFMITKSQEYLCICPKGFSGSRCELINTQIDLIFDKNIYLSHSIFIHFIKIVPFDQTAAIIPETSPERSTTLQTISQATNS